MRSLLAWIRRVLVATPWHPALVVRVDVVRLSWLLAGVALVRGLDYVSGQDMAASTPAPPPGGGPAPTSPLVGIEAAFPLYVWGSGLLLWCAVLVLGMRAQRHGLVWLSHVMLSALYIGLSLGLMSGYLERPYLDGIRNATVLLVPTALHSLLWWRMGPTPIEHAAAERDHEESTRG